MDLEETASLLQALSDCSLIADMLCAPKGWWLFCFSYVLLVILKTCTHEGSSCCRRRNASVVQLEAFIDPFQSLIVSTLCLIFQSCPNLFEDKNDFLYLLLPHSLLPLPCFTPFTGWAGSGNMRHKHLRSENSTFLFQKPRCGHYIMATVGK